MYIIIIIILQYSILEIACLFLKFFLHQAAKRLRKHVLMELYMCNVKSNILNIIIIIIFSHCNTVCVCVCAQSSIPAVTVFVLVLEECGQCVIKQGYCSGEESVSISRGSSFDFYLL